MSDFIHIVCLDAPAPPDYGGAIDMYYKIVALAQTGKKIILHYFEYNQRDITSVKPYCHEVFTYPRKKTVPFTQPYIISSRINKDLVNRLNRDKYPVLLEGLHCSGIIPLLNDPERVVLRMHNDESAYYKSLAGPEKVLTRKIYYYWESWLLQHYQRRLPTNIKIACISEKDKEVLQKEYGCKRAEFIPSFIPWQQVNIYDGMGRYCLYHGNMKVAENEEAAVWLMENVFSTTNIPFTIAGRRISKTLTSIAARYSNVQLVNDPTIEELDKMIRFAQVHVLPSFNTTGVKLKLLHVLLEGRYCIANNASVEGSRAKDAVVLAEEPIDFVKQVERLFHLPFDSSEKKKRQEILALYHNQLNAEKLSALW